jgi:hypothetical protein
MLEEERKFDVDREFTLPDLTGALPAVRATFPAAWAAVSRLEPREWSR